MTTEQENLLIEIQRLVLHTSGVTGRRVMHEVQGWGDGGVWSSVRAVDGDSNPLHQTGINIISATREIGVMHKATVHTLVEQRDALIEWADENRKEASE